MSAYVLAGAHVVAPARADDTRPAAARTGPVTESSVDSKLAWVERMVGAGSAAEAIERSEDDDAKTRLARARALAVKAREARRSGQLGAADASAGEALAEFSAALRRVQSPRQAVQQARRRYEELHERVTGFHEAYLRITAEKSRTRGGVLDEGEVEAALRRAQAAAHEDKVPEAVALLSGIADKLERALTRLRDRETLVQALEFASVDDEYRYERNRNRSYEMLVEIAMDERRLPGKQRDAALAVLADNRATREHADRLAGSGDARAALKALEDSTGQLIGALRAAGYPIP